MKILTRYIISSILKVAIIAILMFALILAAVELFSRMDAIMNGSIPALSIIYYLLLSIPQYLLMVASISFLFAVTYFLSSLTANNELIPILNAGVSPARLKFPIIVLAGVLTILGSVFQEEAVIRINSRRDVVEALKGNGQLQRPSRMHRNYAEFVALYPKRGLKYAVGRCLRLDFAMIALEEAKSKVAACLRRRQG